MTRGKYLQMFMLRLIHVLLFLSTVCSSIPYATLSELGFSTEPSFFAHYKGFSEYCTTVTPGVDYRRDKESIILANFNAHFLFAFTTPHDSPYINAKMAFGHLVKVAEVISKTDADIIHLNEVEDCRVLKMLCDILETKSQMKYMPLLAKGGDYTTRQNVGILTRISPSVEEFKALIKTNEGVSLTKAYVTRFSVTTKDQTINLVLAGAHLLRGAFENDKITPQSIAKRESQALMLADEINHFKETSDYLVLMGDFNDMDPEAPLDDNNVAESETLRILRSKLSASDYSMKNITTLFEGRNRASCIYGRFNKAGLTERINLSIDHILYDDRLKPVNFEILNNLYDAACARGPMGHHYSDHYAVVATFTFPDQFPSLIGDSISQKGPRLNFAASLGAANIQEAKEVNMTASTELAINPKRSFADALKEAEEKVELEKEEETVPILSITDNPAIAPKRSFADALKEAEEKVELEKEEETVPILSITDNPAISPKLSFADALKEAEKKVELVKKDETVPILPIANVPIIAPKEVEWRRTFNSLKKELGKRENTLPIANVPAIAPKKVEWGRISNPEIKKEEEAVFTPPAPNFSFNAPRKEGRHSIPVKPGSFFYSNHSGASGDSKWGKKEETVSHPNNPVMAPRQSEWGRPSNPVRPGSFFINKYSGSSDNSSKWDNIRVKL